MAYTLGNSVSKAINGTTSSIDTTGATLLIAAGVASSGDPTISDSKSNTWETGLTLRDGNNCRTKVWYVVNPTVGTGHTFECGPGGGFAPALVVAAFNGAATASPYTSQESGATSASASTLKPGTLTPSEDGCLVVTALGWASANTVSIDVGSIIAQIPRDGGNSFGIALGYSIQTTAAAFDPTWSNIGSAACSTEMAVFKAAAAAGQPTLRRFGMAYGNPVQPRNRPHMRIF